MDNQPSFDRGLIPPALIGIFSVIGICLLLLVYRYNTSREVVVVTVTETPFKFIFLGTEPAISTEPSPEESVTASLGEETPLVLTPEQPIILTPNTPQIIPSTSFPSTPSTQSTVIGPKPTLTPTSASTPPLNPGTYDDIDFRLVYTGNWVSQTNVSGAYQNTLHISTTLTTPGNSVTFRFIGQEVRLLYQSGASLGVLRVTLDTTVSQLNQSDSSNELVLTASQSGTHTVTLTHLSGGSVNLDSVIVPSVGTATPTATSTPQ
jgi:hypothetical protein